MPRAHSHWRYNTVCYAPTRLRLQPEPDSPSTSDQRRVIERVMGRCCLSQRPRFVECIYLYLYQRLALVKKERDGNVMWHGDAAIYGAWGGLAVGSGWCMETTPEDLNLGRWSPNLFSTPAKVAAARRYPPMWSVLMGGSSEMWDLGVAWDPAGRLWIWEEEPRFLCKFLVFFPPKWTLAAAPCM